MATITLTVPDEKIDEVDAYVAQKYGGLASAANTKEILAEVIWNAMSDSHRVRKGTDAADLDNAAYGEVKPRRQRTIGGQSVA